MGADVRNGAHDARKQAALYLGEERVLALPAARGLFVCANKHNTFFGKIFKTFRKGVGGFNGIEMIQLFDKRKLLDLFKRNIHGKNQAITQLLDNQMDIKGRCAMGN